MATTLQLDEELVEEAQKLGKHASRQATVEDALREYVQRRKQQEILGLFGQIEYAEGYDYKTARANR